jgi:hypothetical protein
MASTLHLCTAMNINPVNRSSSSGSSPNVPAPPVPPLTSTLRVSTQVALSSPATPSSAETTFIPVAIFNHDMNVSGEPVRTSVPLQARRAQTKEPTLAKTGRREKDKAAGAQYGAPPVVEDHDQLSPVQLAQDYLRQDNGHKRQERLDAMLTSKGYDRLQRFNIYLEASRQADNQEVAVQDRKALKVAYKLMMRRALGNKKHAIRRLLQDTEEIDAAITAILGTQDAAAAAASRRRLRFLFVGECRQQDRNKVDVPLKALSLLKGLIKVAGLDGCMKLLPAVRAQMTSGY